jgi:hypothetical protein
LITGGGFFSLAPRFSPVNSGWVRKGKPFETVSGWVGYYIHRAKATVLMKLLDQKKGQERA